MPIWLLDDRNEFPELLHYNRKPVGPVEINLTHKYAQGLVVYVLARKEDGLIEIKNYADSSNPGIVQGTLPTLDPYRMEPEGEAFEMHPSGGAEGFNKIRHTKNNVIGNDDDFTFISLAKPKTITAANARRLHRGVSGDSIRLGVDSSTSVKSSYIDSSPLAQHDATITGLPTISTTDCIAIGCRKKGNKLQTFALVDDTFYSSSETTGGSGSMRDDGSGNAISHNEDTGAGHIHLICDMAYRIALDVADIESLSRNPYQLLAPA